MRTEKKGLKRLRIERLSRHHNSLLNNWMSYITKCSIDEILPGILLGNYGGQYVEVYHADKPLYNLVNALSQKNVKPYALGLHVATIKREKITPALPLARYLVGKCDIEDYCHTMITGKGEKLFLYGRDVLKDNIVDHNCTGIHSVVINERLEPLGWGIIEKAGKELLLTNVKDVGWYIRMGG